VLDIAEGQTVLDVAAAPGGKTTFIVQKMKNTRAIIALEPNGRRQDQCHLTLRAVGFTILLHLQDGWLASRQV
jgi:16S rRNA C967 or C1407 C5-methylase (RsmB/RsmF family)